MDNKNVKKPVKKTTAKKTTTITTAKKPVTTNKTTVSKKTVPAKTTVAKKPATSKVAVTKPANKKVDIPKTTNKKVETKKVDTKTAATVATKTAAASKTAVKSVAKKPAVTKSKAKTKATAKKSSVKPVVKKTTSKSSTATKVVPKANTTSTVKVDKKTEEPKIETRKTEYGTITTERISASEVKKQHETKGISIVKIVICIVLVIALGFACNIIKKLSIINGLDGKLSQYKNSSNYYEKSIPDATSGLESIEVYKKDNVVKSVLKSKTSGIITIINSRYGKRTFADASDGSKVMTYSSETDMMPAINILDFVSGSKWNNALFANIYEEEVNGVKCFVFENLKNDNILYENGTKSFKVYIDMETGLVVQTVAVVEENGVESTKTTKYTYSFNNVSDDDVKSPNINEYEIRTNS